MLHRVKFLWSIFMKKLFNGEYSVAYTYWIGVFGVGALLRIYFGISQKVYLTTISDETARAIEIADQVIAVLYVIYTALMVRALYRAGYNDRTPEFWGWTAIVLTSFSLLINTWLTYALFTPSASYPYFMFEHEIRSMQELLPLTLDDGSAIISISLEDGLFRNEYRIPQRLSELDQAYLGSITVFNDPDLQQTCVDLEGVFRGALEKVEFVYQYENATVEVALTEVDCFIYLQ